MYIVSVVAVGLILHLVWVGGLIIVTVEIAIIVVIVIVTVSGIRSRGGWRGRIGRSIWDENVIVKISW